MTPRILRPRPDLRCAVADNPGPMTLDGTRSYLVGAGPAVLVDPGPAAGLEGRLDRLVGDREVVEVALTHAHPDHAGGAREAARRAGAGLAASAATLDRTGLAGRALEDGDGLPADGGEPALRAVATPGHSDDHLSYWWPAPRAIFTGDLVLGSGSAMVGHPDGHMGRYLASLARLRSLEPAVLYPGHGDPVEEADARLAGYLEHRREREEQIRRAVEDGAASVGEVRRRVYGELPEGLAWAAEASIRAHLEHLREREAGLPEVRDEGDGERPVH